MTSPPSGPDDEIATLVEKIHASPAMAAVAVTGGGAQALTWLLAAPGASRTVLEAVVPYGAKSLEELVGEEIGRPASTDTAVKMAHACYCRGLRLREQAGTPIAGLGCTAALATDRPKRGDHRCSVAVWTDGGVATYDLGFVKGLRDRLAEDGLVSRLVLRALAEGFGLETGLKLDLDDRERLDVRRESHDPIGPASRRSRRDRHGAPGRHDGRRRAGHRGRAGRIGSIHCTRDTGSSPMSRRRFWEPALPLSSPSRTSTSRPSKSGRYGSACASSPGNIRWWSRAA